MTGKKVSRKTVILGRYGKGVKGMPYSEIARKFNNERYNTKGFKDWRLKNGLIAEGYNLNFLFVQYFPNGFCQLYF
jgi:hypothetical protein